MRGQVSWAYRRSKQVLSKDEDMDGIPVASGAFVIILFGASLLTFLLAIGIAEIIRRAKGQTWWLQTAIEYTNPELTNRRPLEVWLMPLAAAFLMTLAIVVSPLVDKTAPERIFGIAPSVLVMFYFALRARSERFGRVSAAVAQSIVALGSATSYWYITNKGYVRPIGGTYMLWTATSLLLVLTSIPRLTQLLWYKLSR